MNGASERSRTVDLLITNELLYQLSYTGVRGNVAMGQRAGKEIGGGFPGSNEGGSILI